MNLTPEDGSVSITPSSLNITYANWRDTFVLSVQSMDDDILQGDRTVSYSFEYRYKRYIV